MRVVCKPYAQPVMPRADDILAAQRQVRCLHAVASSQAPSYASHESAAMPSSVCQKDRMS